MYRFIVKSKVGNYIIDLQENLTIEQAENKYNWFIDNGYYQMANCVIEKM